MNNFPINPDEEHLYSLPSILEQESEQDDQAFELEEYEYNHDDNLAETLPSHVLTRITGQLLDAIEDDFLSRTQWEDGLKEALEQLGLKVDKKEFPFSNACGVYSQVMMQSVIEFYSNAVAELLPLEGPCKALIVGDTTDELEAQSKRVETYANLYFTQIAEEFYADQKKMLMWLPWVGITIRKVYYDPLLKRPTSMFFKPQDFVVAYGTTSLKTCWRMTEVMKKNALDIERYKQMGIYRDISISPIDEGEDQTNLESALDHSEGMSRPAYDRDTEYELYECHTYLDFNEIEDANAERVDASSNYRPYIVTLHKETNQILSIYRNWEEDDDDYTRKDYYVDYGFVEGLGFYKLGAAHLIGGLASACTTLLRQYIDGMTLSNFPGGMHVKGMRLEDNNIRIGPTEFIPVDTGNMPIRDAIMLMPYKEPSQGINEMRKELEQAASKIMGAANAQMGDFNPNAPVGTTYALLDVINLIQSTVIRSARDSMSREFKLFFALFAKHLPLEPHPINMAGGSSFISAGDFSANLSLIPIADPHVTTKMQRLIRAQTIIEMCNSAPDLHNRREAYEMFYKEIKLTDSQIQKLLLPPKEEALPLDPVTENQFMMQGKPVKAYMWQNHQAHMIVHGMMPDGPLKDAHVAEHAAMMYLLQIEQMMGVQLPPNPEQWPQELQNQVALMAAQAAQQMQQQQQENMPPPPLDPAAVMLEDVKVKAAALEQKTQAEELRAQTESFKAQLANEAKMKELEVKMLEIEQRMKAEELKAQTNAFEAQLNYDVKTKE
jgi:hypothetical protein